MLGWAADALLVCYRFEMTYTPDRLARALAGAVTYVLLAVVGPQLPGASH
jgi:hypothetical protein